MPYTPKQGSICPLCELGTLSEEIKDIKCTYKGRTKVFPNETLFCCSLCQYEGLTQEESERVDHELELFRSEIQK